MDVDISTSECDLHLPPQATQQDSSKNWYRRLQKTLAGKRTRRVRASGIFEIYEHMLTRGVIGNPPDTEECQTSTNLYMTVWDFGSPRGRATTQTRERENSDGADFRLHLTWNESWNTVEHGTWLSKTRFDDLSFV